jgi:hypothetical protein
VKFRSHTFPEFWVCYDALPEAIQDLADAQFEVFEQNPDHPSLHFKQTGRYWSARINRSYRVLALRQDADLYWFWIGPHREYERLIKRR